MPKLPSYRNQSIDLLCKFFKKTLYLTEETFTSVLGELPLGKFPLVKLARGEFPRGMLPRDKLPCGKLPRIY